MSSEGTLTATSASRYSSVIPSEGVEDPELIPDVVASGWDDNFSGEMDVAVFWRDLLLDALISFACCSWANAEMMSNGKMTSKHRNNAAGRQSSALTERCDNMLCKVMRVTFRLFLGKRVI